MVNSTMEPLNVWLTAILTALSSFLAVVSVAGYRRTNDRMMGLLSMVFTLIFVRAVLLSLCLFFDSVAGVYEKYQVGILVDIVILATFIVLFWCTGKEEKSHGKRNA